MIIFQIAEGILALILLLGLCIIVLNWFVCKYKQLKLYGYYTNGIYVWKLLQYDSIQATLYDEKEDRMIIMGRNEFIRDFKFLMSDTLSVEIVDDKGDKINNES